MHDLPAIDFGEPIALFPLPACVLLPYATIPLHIFEPRYRQMISDTLESRRLVAMAMFEGDDWKEDYEGKPPLRPHVCVGQVIRHERFADGRYNILLQGLCRARITHELPNDPYRVAILEATESDESIEFDLGETRERLDALLADPLLKQLASVNSIHRWLTSEVPTAAVVDLSIMALCENADQRYRLLAQPEITRRASWLESLLRSTRQTVAKASRFEPPETDDRTTLN